MTLFENYVYILLLRKLYSPLSLIILVLIFHFGVREVAEGKKQVNSPFHGEKKKTVSKEILSSNSITVQLNKKISKYSSNAASPRNY